MDKFKEKMPLIARVLLGLLFFAAGLAGLLGAGEPPPDLPERMKTFNAGLMASGYFMTLLKLTETICGLMLISGFFVPLALVILAPIVLNIVLVHAFMAPATGAPGLIAGLLMVYLAFFSKPYSPPIKQLFRK